MSAAKSISRNLILATVVGLTLISFQNCMPVRFSQVEHFELASTKYSSCILNGINIENGKEATLYESESVSWTAECIPETRTCVNGVFVPKFNYSKASCTKRPLKSLDLNLDSTTTNAPFKLLLVIDNSYSMSPSQEKIAAKLDSLLLPLKGRNVEVKLISTSDSVNKIGKIYNSRTNAFLGKTASNGNLPQEFYAAPADPIHIDYDYTEAGAKLFKLQASDNNQKLAENINAIKSEIKALGTYGSDIEKSFCPIARQLFDTTSTAFFKKDDKAAIVVLSDEDDQSVSLPLSDYNNNDYYQCIKSGKLAYDKPITQDYPAYSGKSYYASYEYDVKYVEVSFSYTIVQPSSTRDGILIPGSETSGVSGSARLTNAATFKDEPNGNCSATLAESSKQAMYNTQGKDHVFHSCKVVTSQTQLAIHYNEDKSNENLCNGGTYTGTYNSYWTGKTLNEIIEDQYPAWSQQVRVGSRCNFAWKEGMHEQAASSSTNRSPLGQQTYIPLVPAETFVQFIDQIFAKAKALLGSGYFITYIVHTIAPDSARYQGQSLGQKYLKAVERNPENSEAVSILSADFSAALTKISAFITKNVVTEYSLQLPLQSTIVKVELISVNGQSRTLAESEYSYANAKLKVIAELKVDDKLRVYYAE